VKDNPELFRRIKDGGHEIGAYVFTDKLQTENGIDKFRKDVEKSVSILEDSVGEKISNFRAPGFAFTRNIYWAFEILIELGMKTDSSVMPAIKQRDKKVNYKFSKPFNVNASGELIKEFPVSLHTPMDKKIAYSGADYFRILPYKAIKEITKKSNYVMAYFHLCDFDPEHINPSELGIVKNLKAMGVKNSFSRLNKYLNEFNFTSIKEAEKNVEWQLSKTFHINLDHSIYDMNDLYYSEN